MQGKHASRLEDRAKDPVIVVFQLNEIYMAKEGYLSLHRVIRPYAGQMIIYAGVTVFFAFVAQKTRQLAFVWMIPAMWLLFGSYIFIYGMRYRVYWNDSGVLMTAAGIPERKIRFSEITEIRYELAGASELFAQSRPFRRIVIVAQRHDPEAFIDVSLRHFRLEDIRGLLSMIHKVRPDLILPATPLDRLNLNAR